MQVFFKKTILAVSEWRDQSANRIVFTQVLSIMVATGVVKVFSMYKDILIAKQFGRGDDIEAFLIAYMVPQFIINIFSGSFVVSVIPVLIQTMEKEGKSVANKIVKECGLIYIYLDTCNIDNFFFDVLFL